MSARESFHRGEVVWGFDLFKETDANEPVPERPFLVLSNDKHPFDYRQFAGVALSTTPRDMRTRSLPRTGTSVGFPTDPMFIHGFSSRGITRTSPECMDASNRR